MPQNSQSKIILKIKQITRLVCVDGKGTMIRTSCTTRFVIIHEWFCWCYDVPGQNQPCLGQFLNWLLLKKDLSVMFHDKYQWEIWKNKAGKSARTGPTMPGSVPQLGCPAFLAASLTVPGESRLACTHQPARTRETREPRQPQPCVTCVAFKYTWSGN